MKNPQIKDRVRQVFRFLKALDEHRNPVVRQIGAQPKVKSLSDLPDHSSVEFLYPVQEGTDTTRPSTMGGDILRVRRPRLSNAPEPPAAYREWVEAGWDDPSKGVVFALSRARAPAVTVEKSEAVSEREALDDDAERVAALAAWQVARDRWAKAERPARGAMKLFEWLYDLHATLDREADRIELFFGDGLLNWRLPSGGINHPVLLQRVNLAFDPVIPEFVLQEAAAPVELYTALLREIEGLDGRVLATIRGELEEQVVSPLQGDATDEFFRRFVTRLSASGEFVSPGSIFGEEDYPRISREPTLFARKRSLGYSIAIETILADLEGREDISAPLARVVGFGSDDSEDEIKPTESLSASAAWSSEVDVLLSRPANKEQIRVVKRLSRTSSVVVQGPPGTGKTHTIANLIGNLLAEGKSVLVTSHTAKALGILRKMIVEPLRALCVQNLGSDTESHEQLKGSVSSILSHLEASEKAELESRSLSLAKQRSQLVDEIERLRAHIADSIKGEYRPLVICGRSLLPSDAARHAAKWHSESEWLPGALEPGLPLPLSEAEIEELYVSNSLISIDDEAELQAGIPQSRELPRPPEVHELAESYLQSGQLDRSTGGEYWSRPAAPGDREALRKLLSALATCTTWLDSRERWCLNLVEIALRGDRQAAPWIRLLEEISEFGRYVDATEESRLRYAPQLPDSPLEEQIRIAEEIIGRLEGGGTLTLLSLLRKPSWRRFIRAARIRSSPPTRPEHFKALHEQILVGLKRQQILQRWQEQAVPIGLAATDASDPKLHRTLAEHSRAIDPALSWPTRYWRPIRDGLSSLGFDWSCFEAEDQPEFSATPELDRTRRKLRSRLGPIVEARCYAAQWEHLEELRRKIRASTNGLRDSTDLGPVRNRLVKALDELDALGFDAAFVDLERLEALAESLRQRERLLSKLEAVAPGWSRAIRQRQGTHGGGTAPPHIQRAWECRQIEEELDRRTNDALPEIRKAIEKREEGLLKVTAELIEVRAWAAQRGRVTHRIRQALVGWLDIVRKTPKTSTVAGKLMQLRKAAQEAMRECREAVPVWIMPMARVVESFDFAKTRFDVAIIDEASQTDVMGLLVYYLADKVLVVGDDEQVSPLAVGQKGEIVQHLIREHLTGIPNAVLYDGMTSVYDLARQSSGATIRLLEHFRCAPEIIQFCNDLCYEGTILPLRDPGTIRLRPTIVPYRVHRAAMRGRINQAEATSVSALVVACIEQPEYHDLSFGVIAMRGDEQAIEIDRLLRGYLSPADYARHEVACGNSAQFQGAERDVVFLSVVDAPADGPLAMRAQRQFRQRFNVAVSRARDQLWVVYSLDPASDLQPMDLRRRLIEHALNPRALVEKLDRADDKTESEFERLVLKRLRDRGYHVQPQYQVGYYRIDLVVEGEGRRLAIECDGDRYHPLDRLGEDMARQATLERLGWRFVRIRGSEFFRDQTRALEPVWEALERLEILPRDSDVDDTPDQGGEESDLELLARIKRRASEIQRAWMKGGMDGGEIHDGGSIDPTAGGASSESGSAYRVQPTGQPELDPRASDLIAFPKDSSDKEPSRQGEESARLENAASERLDGRLMGAVSPQLEDHSTELADRRGEVWSALSHWAKVNEKFESWERGLLYTVGFNLKMGRRISPKQMRHANRVFEAAVASGFQPAVPNGRPPKYGKGNPEELESVAERGRWVSIEDVPQKAVQEAVMASVPLGGEGILRETLLENAKARLGFLRLGSKVRARLNRCIGALVRARRLETDWEMVWLTRKSPTVG